MVEPENTEVGASEWDPIIPIVKITSAEQLGIVMAKVAEEIEKIEQGDVKRKYFAKIRGSF